MDNCGSSLTSFCSKNTFCEYRSTRFIRVRDRRLVSVYYSVILGVILYIILFTVVKNFGYQSFDPVSGTTSLKVKGTGSTGDYSNWEDAIPYDSNDLIYPPTEQDALFVTTALSTTDNQTRGICEGEALGNCTIDDNCVANEYNTDSYGITTGTCGTNYCQVVGWCPLEDDTSPLVVNNVGNFTVFVKVNVQFPAFGVSRSNLENRNKNGAPILGYNLFGVNDMLSRSTDGVITDVAKIAKKGAIIAVTARWRCNLDLSESQCNPTFHFRRLDNETNSISLGYNFRAVDYDPTGQRRRLRKLIGVRFVFVVDGKAGKFSFAALSITFGAGLAYIGIASFITDIVLERFLPDSHKYAKAKNEHISGRSIALSADRIIREYAGEDITPDNNNETKQTQGETTNANTDTTQTTAEQTNNDEKQVIVATETQLAYMQRTR